MALPNFLCVGAQKAGTTTLYEVLKQHPDIFLPSIKEPHFFDEHFQKGLDWYEKTYFDAVKNEKAVGEITPAYLYIDSVPQRIFESLGPDVKLIFIFRNPAERAYSHYLMSKFNGYEKATFEEVMGENKTGNPASNATTTNKRFSYKERGYYGQQLKAYLDLFSKENMLFILFEDLVSHDKKATYERVLNFLEVDKYDLNFNIKSNTAKKVRNPILQKILMSSPWLSAIGKKLFPNAQTRRFVRKKIKKTNQRSYRNQSNKLSSELRKLLIEEYYKEDVKLLENLIDKDLRHWYS